jgi:hypothetical protein
MTTQGNQPSAGLADEAGTPPATGQAAASPSPSHAAPVGDEGREPTTAAEERQGSTSIPDEDPGTTTTTDHRHEMTESTGESQERVMATGEGQATGPSQEQLVSREAAMDFKTRWEAIQQGFVDDPRSAVSDADSLVSDVLKQLSDGFDEQHRQLEAQWSDGEPDTEGLRSALQRYRDFFDRLLTI